MPVWTSIPPDPFGGLRSQWASRSRRVPRWGVPILLLASLPGLAIALLSIVLLVASLLALLLLTLPVYKLLAWVGSWGSSVPIPTPEPAPRFGSPGSKPVDVRVVES